MRQFTDFEAISIGTATLANRDLILIQSTSIQFLLEGAIARAKREGSNSTDIPALQNILAAVVDLHQMVMVTMVPEAIVGAKAISVKDKLIDWWDSDHASILDRGFNMGLFAAGLGLCALAGVVPAVVVATLIRGKEIGEALKEVAKILAGQNTKE